MSTRISEHIRSNVVGYIAIFMFALGGSAYATHTGGEKTISSIDIIDDEVFSADVANDTLAGGGLAAADLRPDSVGTSEVALDSLTGLDLAPDSVTSSELASSSVGTGEVVLDSLTHFDLAPNSVASSELLTNSVGTSEVAADSLNGADIAEATLNGFDPEDVSPRKYAVVNGGPSGVAVAEARSKGITDADVTRAATGIFCFELGYSPDTVIGNAYPTTLAETDRILTGLLGTASNCPAGTDVTVYLRDISAGGQRDGIFYVQFESK